MSERYLFTTPTFKKPYQARVISSDSEDLDENDSPEIRDQDIDEDQTEIKISPPQEEKKNQKRLSSSCAQKAEKDDNFVTPPRNNSSIKVPVNVEDKYPFLKTTLNDFKCLRHLGQGGYGQVFLAEHLESETLFALKFISLIKVKADNIRKTIKHEIQIGTRPFRNQNLLQLRCFFFQENYMVLVMEFCPLGDLYHYLNTRRGMKMDEQEAKHIIWTVSNALQYMHSKHIMHRDIKPENILLQFRIWKNLPPCTKANKKLLEDTCKELENQYQISKRNQGKFRKFVRNFTESLWSILPGRKKRPKLTNEQVRLKKQFIERLNYLDYPRSLYPKPKNFVSEVIPKISDFGWSAHTHQGRRQTQCGTIYYMAPEVINKLEYDFEIDVWAIGILAYEITTGRLPFDGDRDQEIIRSIKQQEVRQPTFISLKAWRFIKRILTVPQQLRPQIEDLILDPWLQDMRILEEKRSVEREKRLAQLKIKEEIRNREERKHKENKESKENRKDNKGHKQRPFQENKQLNKVRVFEMKKEYQKYSPGYDVKPKLHFAKKNAADLSNRKPWRI